jgi:hypothetical protein
VSEEAESSHSKQLIIAAEMRATPVRLETHH